MTNYCVDCKHHSVEIPDLIWCQHPNLGNDLVTGELKICPAISYRTYGCGESGKYFEAKITLCDNGKLFEPKITLKQRFMARLNWWLCRDFDSEHLKNFN